MTALHPAWNSLSLGIQYRSAFVFLAKNSLRGSTLLAQFCFVPALAKAVATSYVIPGLKMSVPRVSCRQDFICPRLRFYSAPKQVACCSQCFSVFATGAHLCFSQDLCPAPWDFSAALNSFPAPDQEQLLPG
jgi:hypothetical protein